MSKRRKGRERREPSFDVIPALDNGRRDSGKGGRAPRGSKRRGGIRRFFYWGAVLSLWAVILGIGATIAVIASLPPIQSLEIPKRPPQVQIVDLQGQPLAVRGENYGAPIMLRNLPRYVPQAFIAIEDRRFYSHFGVDPVGIIRAAFENVMRRGITQGGSTITQQLAKNLFLTQDRTLARKIQEAGLALWLESRFSKTEILELYLNRVYFGAGAYGIEAASQRYFDKPARVLTLAEAAMLAGLVRAPSRLAPTSNPNGAQRRARVVLAAMVETRFITEAMARAAQVAPAHTVQLAGAGSVNYVADWIMDVLDELVGPVEDDIVIETSIDAALQAEAERALVERLTESGGKQNVGQGALISMTPDGTVRAMVGGRNYAESQFNRAVAARRQPGSAFKPFVYLTAIERGLLPSTVRDDKPISIKGWRPENYSREYHGPVTLQQALAYSLNTIAVQLAMEFGPTAVVRTAHRLGIASKLTPNASIALGTSEVTPVEMATAFAAFANGGYAIVPHVIERVRTRDGKVLYTRKPQALGRIIEPRYVGMINQMMQETLLTGTARKATLGSWPAAGKTGTSQEFRDAWFVGYSAHLVTAVWLGNDDSSPMRKVTGGGLPVEIWARYMRRAHQGLAPVPLPGVAVDRAPPIAQRGPWFGGDAPRPPADVSPRPARGEGGGLDLWFLDRLFGSR